MKRFAQALVISMPAVLALGGSAFGQNAWVVSSLHKDAWSENCGWLNFKDAGNVPGSQGVRLRSTFLSGYVWGENIGWINMGNGSPSLGSAYANMTGADFGVNRTSGSDILTGFAWGENVGWINFSGAPITSAARYDSASRRLRGYAWSENVGWINLENAVAPGFVSFRCPADTNDSGTLSVQDIFDFLGAWFAVGPDADFNTDGVVSAQDIFDFLSSWFAGC